VGCRRKALLQLPELCLAPRSPFRLPGLSISGLVRTCVDRVTEEGMARPLLTVVAGGADTGKSLIAEALVAYRGQAMIARDHVRELLRHPVDEGAVTLATFAMARALLHCGLPVCAVGWNLEPEDRAGWLAVARETGADCRWVQVEMPST
jgi:hypothetical protein